MPVEGGRLPYLVNVKDIEIGLLHNLLNQSDELRKDLAGEQLEASTVDGGTVVDTIDKGLNAQLSIGAEAQSLTGALTLKLQLGQTASILARVGLVLLHELLGEVVNDDLVQGGTAELVVVSSGQNGVHATAASKHSNVGASATQVGHDNELVSDGSLRAGIVSHSGSNGLGNELENLKAGSLGGGGKSLTLGIGEVGGNGDHSSVDLLSEEVGGGLLQAAEVTGGDFGDGDGVGGLAGGVTDCESDSRVLLLGVGRLVAWGGVDGLEVLTQVVAEVCDGVLGVADKLSLGLGTVVLLAVDVGEDAGNLTVFVDRVSRKSLMDGAF